MDNKLDIDKADDERVRNVASDSPRHIVCVSGGNAVGGHCMNCGRKMKIQVPVAVDDWCAAMGAFVREHKNCKPRE
jgi:hypothetical protein